MQNGNFNQADLVMDQIFSWNLSYQIDHIQGKNQSLRKIKNDRSWRRRSQATFVLLNKIRDKPLQERGTESHLKWSSSIWEHQPVLISQVSLYFTVSIHALSGNTFNYEHDT